ncbi:MAG: hypothetical protein ACPGN3_17845 [Opitutales bacterium]
MPQALKMITMDKHYSRNRAEGSALVTVMILTAVMAMVFAAYIRFSMQEHEYVSRYQLKNQAQLAAESLSDYAAAEVINSFKQLGRKDIEDFDFWTPDITAFDSLITNKNIDRSSLNVTVTSLDETGSDPAAFEDLFIDPDNPAYYDDPDKDEWVFARTLRIYATATARNGGNSSTEQSAYVEQVIQLRYNSLLDFAIFCDSDLEFLPEREMHIYGDVHTNQDLYVSSTVGLHFVGKVSASGIFQHGVKVDDGNKFREADGLVSIYNPNEEEEEQFVTISRTSTGEPFKKNGRKGPNENSNGASNGNAPAFSLEYDAYVDNHPNNVRTNGTTFAEEAETYWNGYLKDRVDTIELPGIVAGGELNENYVALEPLISDVSENKQKYSHLSGLILRVTGTARQSADGVRPYNGATGNKTPAADYQSSNYVITGWVYERDSDDNVIFENGGPKEKQVYLPPGLIGDANYSMDLIEVDGQVEVFQNAVAYHEYDETVPLYERHQVEVTGTNDVVWYLSSDLDPDDPDATPPLCTRYGEPNVMKTTREFLFSMMMVTKCMLTLRENGAPNTSPGDSTISARAGIWMHYTSISAN